MADGNAINRIFLKKILYRIDFQFITEKVQEELYSFVTEKYGAFFADQFQEFANEIDVEVSSANLDQPKWSRKTQPIFVFTHPKSKEADGRSLKIGRTFLFLELELRNETMGIPYYNWIAEIVGYLRDNPIFKITRVGVRKFNNFYILEKHRESLKDIFSIDYLSSACCDGFTLDNFSNSQVYIVGEHNLRFSRNYSSGILSNNALALSNEVAHLISFDFDIFTSSDEWLHGFKLNASEFLLEMNDVLYKFFCGIIHPTVIDELNSGSSLDNYNIIPY